MVVAAPFFHRPFSSSPRPPKVSLSTEHAISLTFELIRSNPVDDLPYLQLRGWLVAGVRQRAPEAMGDFANLKQTGATNMRPAIARCTEAGCANLGRLILRYADTGGRPMSSSEFCYAHARVRVARACTVGLKVYDDREVSLQPATRAVPTRGNGLLPQRPQPRPLSS